MKRLEFGICMEGFEPHFADLINRLWPTDGSYLEIGLAHGKTFMAVGTLLGYRMGDHWRAYGIDPNPLFGGDKLKLQQSVCTKKSQDALVEIKEAAPFALVLIDGCHCEECCQRDFVLVWPHVQRGGFVLFHDYAPGQQGGGAQAYHDNRPIQVMHAVQTLKETFAVEWREHLEWVGDRTRGNVANMGVFEKL